MQTWILQLVKFVFPALTRSACSRALVDQFRLAIQRHIVDYDYQMVHPQSRSWRLVEVLTRMQKSVTEEKKIGTFCKTKIAIFVKARGRGAKKWRMFANIHTKVRVDSLLREQNFRFEIGLSWGESSGSAGSERWFGWFFPFNWICQHFFCIEILSRFGLRWCSVDQRLDFGEWHAGWLFEPGASVDGHRISSNWQWTWFCVCGLEEQRTKSSSSMSPSSWESSRRREKCENPPSQPNKKPPKQLTPNSANYEARLPNRHKNNAHLQVVILDNDRSLSKITTGRYLG